MIFAQSTPVTAALQRETRTIPIVFVAVSDPIGSGFVANLARPGSNITGLLYYEASIAGKWLAILKEIAPRLTRAALVADPKTTPYDYFLRGAKAAAPSLAIELLPSPVENAADIESVIESVARVPNGGLVLPPDATTIVHRDLIIALAARYRLPAVYALRDFVVAGGLMAYSSDIIEQNRQRHPTSTRSCAGPIRPNFQCRRRRSLRHSSILELRERSISTAASYACARRRGDRMRRREFISLFGGAAASWPLAVWAQQPDRVRRIGVLMSALESGSEYHVYVSDFRKELQKLGWAEGRNLRIDYRWARSTRNPGSHCAQRAGGHRRRLLKRYANRAWSKGMNASSAWPRNRLLLALPSRNLKRLMPELEQFAANARRSS